MRLIVQDDGRGEMERNHRLVSQYLFCRQTWPGRLGNEFGELGVHRDGMKREEGGKRKWMLLEMRAVRWSRTVNKHDEHEGCLSLNE